MLLKIIFLALLAIPIGHVIFSLVKDASKDINKVNPLTICENQKNQAFSKHNLKVAK